MSKKSKKDCHSKEKSFEKKLKKTMKKLSKKEKSALQEAAMIIWLNDRSDYINGLWCVIEIIMGYDLYHHKDFNIEKILTREGLDD